ncbi:hypothetical protein ONO23_01237 [Micromonospora noduli]|uniref:Integral membrane protein n=2 Tax=Micromonospora noduli TaxID=709876 RepID=A0ABX9CTB9_9ACTN|nr:hypothetical protein MED15_06012 [Micromonospora noduli]RAO20125.1 hypothetical protein LUPAC07_01623 [Micromonospora noduli]RAO37701.1 hypothetical protein ONO23_01237 [Micromonospora noduli]RAO58806.1 hypothetical protein ONO86_00166 [Micromonospora noduli]
MSIMLFLGLLLAALAGAVIATVLTVRGFRAMLRNSERSGRVRTAALLVGAGAVALYAWGLLHLGYAVMQAEDGGAGSAPVGPCRQAGPQVASRVVDYDISFLPLHFECRLSGGGTYVTSSVPGYVNPGTAGLGLVAATCGVLATTTARRARQAVT